MTPLQADLDLYARRGVELDGLRLSGVVERAGCAHAEHCSVSAARPRPLTELKDLLGLSTCARCLSDSSDLTELVADPALESFIHGTFVLMGAEDLGAAAAEPSLSGRDLVEALTRFVTQAHLPSGVPPSMEGWLAELRAEVAAATEDLRALVDLDEVVAVLASRSATLLSSRLGPGPVGVSLARAALRAHEALDATTWVLFTVVPHWSSRRRPGFSALSLEASVLLALAPATGGVHVLPMSTWRHLELELSPARLCSALELSAPPSPEVLETLAVLLEPNPGADLTPLLDVARALA
jgi:hypothetical protein